MKAFIINYDLIRNYSETNKGNQYDEMVFYGVLENGKSFSWKQTKPYLICFSKNPLPSSYEKYTWKKIDKTFQDYRKNPLIGYFFKNQSFFLETQEKFPEIEFQEKDISCNEQFLMSKHIRGCLNFISSPTDEDQNMAYYTDPEIEPLKELFFPKIKVLSLDIETGVESDEVYSIGLYGANIKKTFMLDKSSKGKDQTLEWGEIIFCNSEKKLLDAFLKEVIKINPHIFIGWNVMGFDFNYLTKKFLHYQIPFELGIGFSKVIHFKGEKSKSNLIIKIPGRAIIEGMDLVRTLFPPLPNYKLDTASEYVLETKKTINKIGSEKIAEIERLYRENKIELAHYNLVDSKLVYEIFEKLNGINFCLMTSILSGAGIEKIFNPHELLDRYYLPLLHQKKIAAYSSTHSNIQLNSMLAEKNFKGGFFKDVALLEFDNIFLSVILAFNIDPLGMVRAQIDRENSQATSNGVFFHNTDSILPHVIKKLLDLQKPILKENKQLFKVVNHILKQNLQAFSSSYSRHFLPGLYDVIHNNVRLVMETIVNKISDLGNTILYYDNVSLVVKINESFEDFQKKILALLNQEFLFSILPRLEKKNEYLFFIKRIFYFKYFFIPDQFSTHKNKSNLEYKAIGEGNTFIKYGGKKATLPLVEKISNQIIYKLLLGEGVEELIKDFKKNLFTGYFDKELIYTKRLSKKLSEYTSANLPPHAVAAMKIKDKFEGQKSFFDKVVHYYQTINGPEPIQDWKSEIDYSYYLEKEFFPATERILKHSKDPSLSHMFQNKDLQLSLF